MKIEIELRRVKKEDIDRAKLLFGESAFSKEPRAPCRVSSLIKCLTPETVEILERIDMLENPNKYFPLDIAEAIDWKGTLAQKNEYCKEKNLYEGIVDRRLRDNFYGDSIKTGKGLSNSIAPGLAGYLITYAIISHRHKNAVLKQIRALDKDKINDYLNVKYSNLKIL